MLNIKYFVEEKDGRICRLFETFAETVEGCVECSKEEYEQYESKFNEQIETQTAIVLSPEQLREQAYETRKIIDWEGRKLTVDEANKIWLNYSAEGNEKANQISALIVLAKDVIRQEFPDA